MNLTVPHLAEAGERLLVADSSHSSLSEIAMRYGADGAVQLN
jgi:hypothetical protein